MKKPLHWALMDAEGELEPTHRWVHGSPGVPGSPPLLMPPCLPACPSSPHLFQSRSFTPQRFFFVATGRSTLLTLASVPAAAPLNIGPSISNLAVAQLACQR